MTVHQVASLILTILIIVLVIVLILLLVGDEMPLRVAERRLSLL